MAKLEISEKLWALLYAAAAEILVPELARLVASMHAQEEVITEAGIKAQLEARAAVLLAGNDAWQAARPVTPDPPA